MAFSYSINAGKLAYQKIGVDNGNTGDLNANYLANTFGFSENALSGVFTNSSLDNPSALVNEYKAIFGKNLAISDAYMFFDQETNENPYSKILDSTEIKYTADKAVSSRIDVYKEMFLEKFSGTPAGATTDITTTDAYDDTYQGNGIGLSSVASLVAAGTPAASADLDKLYKQLETEATKLKGELNQSELAFGGYPEIGYSSTDAKVKLLNQQLDVAMQNYLKVYDELFGHYKIKAGAHATDDQLGDFAIREQEAATAATMTAKLAMDYAEKYYSQNIKPAAKDYVFGQAPITFSIPTTATTGDRSLFTGADQNITFNNILEDYTVGTTAQLNHVFINANNSATATIPDYKINNTSVVNTINATNYNNIFYNLSTNATLVAGTADKGAAGEGGYLNEVGPTEYQYISWMVRDTFGVGGLTANVRNTDYCSENANYLAGDMVAAAEKIVNIKMQLEKISIEGAVNNQFRAEYEARLGAMAAINQIRCPNGVDPYTVNINGQQYMLGQDQDQDGTINSMIEILGTEDTKENTFASLKKLDTNNDGYVSQEELQAQKIILSAVNNQGQLGGTSYDMSLVKGINLADLQKIDGGSNLFGKFTMDLKDQKVNGELTFEDDSYFNKLFGWDMSTVDNIDEDTSVAPIVIPVSTKTTVAPAVAATPQETTPVAATEAASTTEKSEETTTPSALDTKNFSFSFSDATDNKSTIEKLLDQLCWKLGITDISSSQKYDIIDGIDPNTDANIAESQIQEDLEKFNLSA